MSYVPHVYWPRCSHLFDLFCQMFERIVASAPGNRTLSDEERRHLEESLTPIYTVHVHSSPGEPVTEVSAVLDKSLPPWVVTFDDFLTPEECDALIQLGHRYGYKRSEDVGGQRFDGTFESVTNNRRTSENAWCSDHGGCRNEEIAQRIHQRMAMVMGIPAENSEDLQLLRYEQGQFYRYEQRYRASGLNAIQCELTTVALRNLP